MDKRVRAAFDDFVVLDVYCDEKDADLRATNQALEQRLANTVAQPTYLILRPDDESVISQWGYKRKFLDDPDTYRELLTRGLEQFKLK